MITNYIRCKLRIPAARARTSVPGICQRPQQPAVIPTGWISGDQLLIRVDPASPSLPAWYQAVPGTSRILRCVRHGQTPGYRRAFCVPVHAFQLVVDGGYFLLQVDTLWPASASTVEPAGCQALAIAMIYQFRAVARRYHGAASRGMLPHGACCPSNCCRSGEDL